LFTTTEVMVANVGSDADGAAAALRLQHVKRQISQMKVTSEKVSAKPANQAPTPPNHKAVAQSMLASPAPR
jgi:hypothetical protein